MAYSSNENLPRIDSLVAALAAARLGSFSAAALELGITHASVSRRVAAAEDWAGIRLFDRHGRGVQQTPDGQRMLVRAQLALESLSQLNGQRRQKRLAPTVRVAVTPSFARFWMLRRTKELEGAPESIRLEIVADLRYADILGGEVDLAIRYGRGNWEIGQERKLFEETLVPVVSRSTREQLRSVSSHDLIRLPLLHNGDTTNWRGWCEHHSVAFKPKAADRTFVEYGLSLDGAAAGLGIALWNRSLHPVGPGLVPEPRLAAPSTLAYHLISRTNDTKSPAAALAGRILEAAAKQPPRQRT